MDNNGLFNRFTGSSWPIRIAAVAVVVVWTLVVVTVIAFTFLLLEKPIQTLPPAPGEVTPAISLEPAAGPPGTTVSVRGEGWNPGSLVLIYLMAPGETELPSYAVAGNTANAVGGISTRFVVPSDSGWENQGLATIVARATESGAAAQVFFSVASVTPTPTATPTPIQPTSTPGDVEAATTPTAISQSEKPTVTSITDLNIRAGPGITYPVLGVLRAGQRAEVTGLSVDGNWWQIVFSRGPEGRGWVSALYVTAENAQNVSLVQAASLPPPPAPTPTPTPTPTPIPVVITDWRGEYYNNPDLNGQPILVRNDVAISFDWGSGSPGSGVPADNFSARWSRGLNFSAGTYRFYTRVDDGVRLWIDGSLIIDRWYDSAPTLYSAGIYLSGGWHSLRMEYYERTGDALAQLAWERLDQDQDQDDYPDWKAEYYDNRKLEGDPVLVRNDDEIDFDWGRGSPGSGVPDDNFSARWTQEVDFDGGTYLFKVRVDDGVRLWVDDDLVIDSWRDGSARLIEEEYRVEDGERDVEVEYYERGGDAEIEVSWERLEEPANQSPTAVPGGPYTVDEGSLLSLDGSGSRDPDGSIVKYEWDLNYDGRNFVVDSTGQTVSTRYEDGPATVTVALRVTDNDGASHLATTQVTVKNVAPVAEAGGPYVGQVDSPINMAGTGTDPGSLDQAGLNYTWDFGDGNQGSGPIVNHSYAQAGDYTLTLTVSDKDGAQGTDTASVKVELVPTNQPPTAVISGATRGLVGETLSFDGAGSSDSDGSIVDYAWDFGDGNRASGRSVTHSYNQAGSYSVVLTVTDDDDLSDTSTYTLLIEETSTNQSPVAVIDGPENALVGETIIFDSGGSHDPGGTIVSYVWDFGEGGVSQLAPLGDSTLAHIYNAPGTYQVTLTVTDDGGLSDTDTFRIVIEELVVNQPPQAVINAPSKGLVGEVLTFDASSSSDPEGGILSYAWDFGDGNTANGASVSHSYSTAGNYNVVLTVTDDEALSDTSTYTLVIGG